jgi:hypothetical protein
MRTVESLIVRVKQRQNTTLRVMTATNKIPWKVRERAYIQLGDPKWGGIEEDRTK